MVLEQGEPISSLETNIDNTLNITKTGVELLRQADSYHKKWLSKRNKFILVGIAGLSINAPVTVFFGIKAGIISGLSTLGLGAITSLF